MNFTRVENPKQLMDLSAQLIKPHLQVTSPLIKPGSVVVVAVSGGIDSMSLLHILSNCTYKVIVAHYDHGIRAESANDAAFVCAKAKEYGMLFELGKGMLDATASEKQAREFRYKFLKSIVHKYNAATIVTAHHQDDEIETAVINILRGTGRKGLTPMRHNENIWRPFLSLRKADIEDYARAHNIAWREDATNQEDRYLRNYVRHNITPRITANAQKFEELRDVLDSVEINNKHVNERVRRLVKSMTSGDGLSRKKFINLPHTVASEIMIAWLDECGCPVLDRKRVEILTVRAKTGRDQSRYAVSKGVYMHITKTHLKVLKKGLI